MDLPPLPPPKPELDSASRLRPKTVERDNRSSIIPMSPGISSAVNFMRMGEEQRERAEALELEKVEMDKEEMEMEMEREREMEKEKEKQREREKQREEEKQSLVKKQEEAKEQLATRKTEGEKVVEKAEEAEKKDAVDKGDMKDSWRKSDSTISHVTIRPGAGSSRPSRPVSMAESLQSNHTIVPVNKRLSALITDSDFGMPEEDDSDQSIEEGGEEYRHNPIPDDDVINILSITESLKSSPTASLKSRTNRRSMSLNISSHSAFFKPDLPPTPSSPSAAEVRNLSYSFSEGMHSPPSISPSLSRETPTLSRTTTTATGFISPSSSGPQPTGHNIRGRLAAWTAVGHSSSASSAQRPPAPPPLSASRQERSLPALPPHQRHPQVSPHQHPLPQQFEYPHPHQTLSPLPQLPGSASPSFRQTAISMTSGFAPAAGLAKRAVEKMGRAWGGISSSSSNSNHGHSYSGYSSSSSAGTGTAPSSYSSSGHHHHHHPSSSHGHGHGSQEGAGFAFGSSGNELALGRTYSNQSSSGGHHTHQVEKKGKMRRTPHAPSASSSIMTGSSVSISDSEVFAEPSGPVLGKRLRGPLRAKTGVVFGRDLRNVVRETGVGVGKPKAWGGRWRNWDEDPEVYAAGDGGEQEGDGGKRSSIRREQLKALEERRLPALVVRCAQHLLIWGIQEEGLFRVSGRPSHVSKLRAEFDTGADFDMTECAPGDLDPHAVASVFRAFLRELPEPLLTHALIPYFEVAMNQEFVSNSNTPKSPPASRTHSRGPGLPSSPKNGGMPLPAIRKPPSLSTLAMPSFTSMRPPSRSLLNAFQSLILKLPEENRDLLRTVTELIKATAQNSKATKMPLSNLLLVFCPSLNMNPPLLRVLCEAEGIWEQAPVMVIQREEADVIDIKPEAAEESEEEFLDAREGTEEDEEESLQSESVGRTSEDLPSSVEYESSSEGGKGVPSRVKLLGPRKPVSTMGLDADDSSLLSQPVSPASDLVRNGSLRDDGSSCMSDRETSLKNYVDSHSTSPPLLTSAESDTTSTTNSSAHSSFAHLPIPPVESDSFAKKAQEPGRPVPLIAELPMELSPTTPRRPLISNPMPVTGAIQFPTSSTGITSSHAPPAAAENRRSIPVLSLPNFSPPMFHSFPSDGSRSPDSPSASSILGKRLKKPSLQLLFAKKSSASSLRNVSSPEVLDAKPIISGPYLQNPRSASDSSVSTPRSAVTAPQSSTCALPPKLDTPIESSSLKMELGVDDLDFPTESDPDEPDAQERPPRTSISPRPPALPSASMSTTSLSSTTPPGRGQTPIADRFNRPPSPSAKSVLSITSLSRESEISSVLSHLRPYPARTRAATSTSSIASSNHLGLLEDDGEEPEDWTASVLMAADVDGNWIASSSAL